MIRCGGRWVLAIALTWGATATHEAGAQFARGVGTGLGPGTGTGANSSTTGAPTPAGLYANPYTNPYMNPFLNPYMTQNPTSAGNAALFFLAAQQATGGIGSGQLSGVRPARSAATAPPPRARTEDQPGAMPPNGAGRYFNRSLQTGGEHGHYYNRPGSYFRKNVR